MPISDARRRANNKWLTERVENVTLRVPKGKRELIQEHATKTGESVNAFINRAIEETIRRDQEKPKIPEE